MSTHHDFRPTREEDHVSRRVIAWATVIGAVFAVLCLCVAVRFTRSFTPGARTATQPARAEIGWVEQTPIRETERGLEVVREQRRSLERWGWADRSRGIARVPIERAIDLVVADGGT